MPGTSRFRAKTILGMLAGACVAACSLVGGDVDHYNSGDGGESDTTADASPGTEGKADASANNADTGGGSVEDSATPDGGDV